jgi:pyridoxamine 5'-phosphate oxidase
MDEDLRQRLKEMRRSYGEAGLVEDRLPDEPFALFTEWLHEASENPYIVEPNAMVLGTSDLTSRTVLLKDITSERFTFFTNYGSRKAKAITSDPRVTLTFPWYPMERQVLVIGRAERVAESESDAYFGSRPYGSQIGAWASHQSELLTSRQELQSRFEELSARYKEGSVPRPPQWGGFSITPEEIEFWQGRHSRLHDRIRFTRDGNHWQRVRLNP